MSDDADPETPRTPGFGDLESPFLFVPHGAPEPVEWMRKHPGWVKFPATFVPRAPTAVRTIPGTNRPWPLDKRGQPWPRSRFGQPLRPLDEYPPGVRAPGEGYTGPIADPDEAMRAAMASENVLAQAAKYAADPDAPIKAYLSAMEVWKNPGKYAGDPGPLIAAYLNAEPVREKPWDQVASLRPEASTRANTIAARTAQRCATDGARNARAPDGDTLLHLSQERHRDGGTPGRAANAGTDDAPTLAPVDADQVRPVAVTTDNVAFVGGFGDRTTDVLIVEAARRYERNNPSVNVQYFTWDEGNKLEGWIRKNKGEVTVIGHSYGGDTAATVVAQGNKVRSLITLDPVSLFRPDFNAVRANVGEWRNYNAVGGSRFASPNIIAGVGRAWNERPKGYAHFFQDVNLDHAQIGSVGFLQYLLPGRFGR